jgi:PAS domain S-box-containing protein
MLYFAFAEVGFGLQITSQDLSVFWPAAGLAIALFASAPRELYWYLVGGLSLATVAGNILHGTLLVSAIGLAVANSAQAVVAGRWLGTRLPQGRRIVRHQDVTSLAVAAAVGPLVGALIGAAWLRWTEASPFGPVFADWWVTRAESILIIVPAALAIVSLLREPPPEKRIVPTISMALFAALGVLAWVLLTEANGESFIYLASLPLLVSAFWLESRSTTLLLGGVTFSVVWLAERGVGFAEGSQLDPVLTAQLFAILTVFAILTFAVESGRRRDLVAEMAGVLDAAVEAVMVVDETGVIRRANKGAFAMFGLTADDLIGTQFADHVAIADGQLGELFVTEGKRNDGRDFWAEISQGTIDEPSGRRRRAVIVRDVTERVETGERVQRLQDEFVSNMTHELRTPLTAIVGYTDYLLANPETAAFKDDLQIIQSSAASLKDTIDDILEFKRQSADRVRLSPVALEPIANEAIAMTKLAAAERGIQIRTKFNPTAKILGDRGQLEGAIRNLLSNAIKYSPDGGPIEISLNGGAEAVVFTVSDHGVGISEEDQARLFERFFRASNAADIPGTGLGLAMVRQVAKTHGGELKLTSKLGVGTTVELTLPPVAAGSGKQSQSD